MPSQPLPVPDPKSRSVLVEEKGVDSVDSVVADLVEKDSGEALVEKDSEEADSVEKDSEEADLVEKDSGAALAEKVVNQESILDV